MEAHLVDGITESGSICFLLNIFSGDDRLDIFAGSIGEFPFLEFVEWSQNGFEIGINGDGLAIRGIKARRDWQRIRSSDRCLGVKSGVEIATERSKGSSSSKLLCV